MNTNINCFTLMHNACKKLKGNFLKALIATFIVVAPLVAIAFIPYYIGIVLAVFFSGYLFYGLIVFYQKLFAGENPSYKVIFTNFNKFGAATITGAINSVCLILGFILLIFPSLVYVVYYGVNLHILANQGETKVKEAFDENSNRMIYNKTLVLSYKILCYFLMSMVIVICGLIFLPVSALYASNYALCVFLGVLIVLLGIVLLTFVQVLYQATQLEFYQTCLPTVEESDEYRKNQNEKAIERRKSRLNKKECCTEECCEREEKESETTNEKTE